jgi:hypothetical protein
MERKNIIAIGLASLISLPALTSCESPKTKSGDNSAIVKMEDPTKIQGVSKEALPIPGDFDSEKKVLTSLLLTGLRNNFHLTKKANRETVATLNMSYSEFENIIGRNTKCDSDKGESGNKSNVRCVNKRDWYDLEASSSPDGKGYGFRISHRQVIPKEIWDKQSSEFKNAKLNYAFYNLGSIDFTIDESNSMMNKTHKNCLSQTPLNYKQPFGYIDTKIGMYNFQNKSEVNFGISNIVGNDLTSNASRILSMCMRESRDK